MAKDPAFLFYPGDYISGTMYLDFECKGAYIDLLMLQFQKDHMSIHMIKQVLGHRHEHIWPQISDKFLVKEGRYWNERLRIEKYLRSNYCNSRKNNRNGGSHKSPHKNNHMSSHMEDENEDINEDINTGLKQGKNINSKNNHMTKNDQLKVALPFSEPEFIEKWAEWIDERSKKKIKSYTERGVVRVLNELKEMSGDDYQIAIKIIEQSLNKGWQGLFGLKNNYKNGTHQQQSSTVGKTIEFDRP